MDKDQRIAQYQEQYLKGNRYYGENLSPFQVYSPGHLFTRQQEMGLFHLEGYWNLGVNGIKALS